MFRTTWEADLHPHPMTCPLWATNHKIILYAKANLAKLILIIQTKNLSFHINNRSLSAAMETSDQQQDNFIGSL